MGTIFDEGEAGVLLNDDAIQLLVNEMLNRIENLVIRQAKGYMYVDDITVDYNTGRMMRIKEDSKSINQNNDNIKYAVYFAAK
jgi:ATP-dependent protease HslVU (ClpYQ) ATPase subunit